MAKPNVPKEVKPQNEEDKKKPVTLNSNVKMIIINVASTLLICILFLCVNYLLQDKLLGSKLNAIVSTQESEEEPAEEEEQIEKGIIVDLGDFVLNLADASQKRYLKANVALELSKLPTDPDLSAPKAEGGGGHGGGHGGGGEAADPMKVIETEMAQYKPAIRDAIITNLSSKTSAEVATAAGKELVKEQISQDINAIFAGTREVIRVSFGQFIIQ